MRTVVVGGLGFLGSAIAGELLSRGDDVLVVDRRGCQTDCDRRLGADGARMVAADMLDAIALQTAFAGADEVYHLAGRLGTSELEDDVHGAITANITGAITVFEAAIAAHVPTVFYPSKPNVWLNAYTVTKIAAEQFAQIYTETRGIRICSLRYFNAYGPWQSAGPVRKIVPTFARQAMRGEVLTVYGDGEQTVDMIHAADIGRLTVDFTRSGHQGRPPDCGRGVSLTVNEVACAVNDFFGTPVGIEHVAMRRGETPCTRLVADIEPLRQLLGGLHFVDWPSSLATTLAWYADQVAFSGGPSDNYNSAYASPRGRCAPG